MENIESLRKEVDDIKNSLNELRNNVSLSEIEKKNRAEALKTQAETTKLKIQNEINSLSTKTDDESKRKKEEAEALLHSFNEIMNLYVSVLNSTESKQKQQGVTEERGFFGKAGDWIGEQWSDVINGDKRKTEPGKNVLRAVGFGVSGYALYKGVKKLWNRAFGDEEKEQEEKKSEKKERSFRKTGWGKFLKWTGIAGVAGGGIYGVTKLLGGKKDSQSEIVQEGGVEISEAMFKQLLYMEGDQDFVAKTHGKKFGENFVTGPYGMVYKHIDENGKLLSKPVPFKNGERVSKDWAEKNARVYYNKRAKERSDLLKSKGYKYSQDMLDALVSASGGTKKSVDNLKSFVLSHWDDKDAIFNYISKFATTAAGNGKTMPGLVIRRNFEANWFRGNKEPLLAYQKRYYQDRHYA